MDQLQIKGFEPIARWEINETTSSFLDKQVQVVNSQRGQLLVRSLEVKQQSTEGNENGPKNPLVSLCSIT